MKYGKNILLKGNSANVRLFVLLGLAAAVGFVIFLGMLLSPVTLQGEGREVVVAIPQEAVAATIGKILEEEGLVRSSVAFNLYTRCMGLDARIKAGHYVLNSGFSTPRLAMELVNGQQVFYRVTIPEGFNTEQIADLLAEKVLELRFGLHDGARKTQREIARNLGISRSYVSRIEKRALGKLSKELILEGYK
jgi:cell division protein YceG involved in septum cleavage